MEFDNKLKPIRVYHGTNEVFEQPDLAKAKKLSNYGKGFYTTTSKDEVGYYGENINEYELEDENILEPSQLDFSDEQKKKLYKDFENYFFNEFSSAEQTYPSEMKRLKQLLKEKNGKEIISIISDMANSKNVSVGDYLKELGVGDFSSMKVPSGNDEYGNDYYIVFDPKKLKFIKRYKRGD